MYIHAYICLHMIECVYKTNICGSLLKSAVTPTSDNAPNV